MIVSQYVMITNYIALSIELRIMFHVSRLQGQYIFIHDALLEFIKVGITELLASDLRDRIKALKEHSAGGILHLSNEFQVSISLRSHLH